jgi:hypothetical protein
MLSQMSQDDLKTLVTSLGLGDMLDNPQSLKYNSPLAPYAGTLSAFPPTAVGKGYEGIIGGNGICNNLTFLLVDNTSNYGDLEVSGTEYQATYNNGYCSRLKTIVDTISTISQSTPNLFGANGGTGSAAATTHNLQLS